jgi:hypothetical protein
MSSHREAPEISKDPVADSTDLYAFVSPDRPDTVTLIANYVPLESPAGGPNFYEFGDDVLYEINVDNDGDARPDVVYRFTFTTEVRNRKTFLYNTGPIGGLDDPNWNRRQFFRVTQVVDGHETVLGDHLASPPCNIGPRSTPNYAKLAQAAVHDLPGGVKVFAGQRREGFYVDLGSIFDLGALRPVQEFHLIPMASTMGVDATKDLNVHTIAMQVPKTVLTAGHAAPTNPADSKSVVGVWTAAYRRKARVRDGDRDSGTGPWVQVSRLGTPLFNEVIVPMVEKDRWNALPPKDDKQFRALVEHPELAQLLPVLYPHVFPNLAAYQKARADLVAILLTGIPGGVVPGFPGNFTGQTPADLLRLNLAVGPAAAPNRFGLLGGDIAGFPNGRRVADDAASIAIRAVAGVTLPLVDPTFQADAALSLKTASGEPRVAQGIDPDPGHDRFLPSFPYLGVPKDGFHTPAA